MINEYEEAPVGSPLRTPNEPVDLKGAPPL